MPYDLRSAQWIPWLRRDGAVEWGAPARLVEQPKQSIPIVGVAAPRPDFAAALQEFLIGLLTAALMPADEAEWRRLWRHPPSRDELHAALMALPPAFNLDGDGPRIFQDFSAGDFASATPIPIEQLLIESPGEQSVRHNKDLFVKRHRAGRFGRPAAAMALITMQTYAPSGGQGHRTSLRGGGPLTTLVEPRVSTNGEPEANEQPLWRKLWANVETRVQLANRTPTGAPTEITLAFPWLGPTRTSNPKAGGRETTPSDVHPLQAYFGLPRRIRLVFGEAGRCELTGREDESTITSFCMLNYGTQYTRWRHPLSPYYCPQASDDWLPVHAQSGGIGWRDWLGIALAGEPTDRRERAATVAAFDQRGDAIGVSLPRLTAVGFEMDNMKALGWAEATLPGLVVEDEVRRRLLTNVAFALTEGCNLAAALVLAAVRRTLSPADEPRGDLGHIRSELWNATESAFYGGMRALAARELDTIDAIERSSMERQQFATRLRDDALDVFDRWCPPDGLNVDALRRRVIARYNLLMALSGRSKMGEKLFTVLGVPGPEGARPKRLAKGRRANQEREGAIT